MTNILDVPMDKTKNDAGATSVREYLRALLFTLWEEGEGFSGKRPFGNSGWEWELFRALVESKDIRGELDEDGYLQDCDEKAGHALIKQAIAAWV